MIRVHNLRKRFGPIQAVDGVSFDVSGGETFGLLGPNGAGKTTTLHLLLGLLRPDDGSITIHESRDPRQPAVRRHIGVAPQALALYDNMTAAENMRFFGRLYGLDRRQRKARTAELLDKAGLANRADDRVRHFSEGMKRRLQLAIALVHQPDVLLLDEPTVGIDPQSRRHILTDIRQLKSQGRIVIYTTHYMEEAQQLCDRVAIMDHGRILVMDTVSALLARYGGASVVEAELETLPENPAALPGQLIGQTLRIQTDAPFRTIQELSAEGLAIAALHVHRPNLETVFLKLTGRSLRD